ncbi:hypothetical protein [Arthrobacter sp. ISL-30]|uniref:hypothetical protein n=1 Tax=Arthrobacter sp. ISL-30 TaxID=2819109 RepID=UPI001BE8DE71|nr:hypothetical protein [Arthrobacter sp. ISL-30]MBT2514365.1 hypothetical protein [Arthrobacter sp. ISL-30]
MTTRSTPHDEQIVDQLLLETDTEDAAELRFALLELRSFAAGPPPAPSAKLAALMAPRLVSLDDRRKRKHHRAGLAALAVAMSMGMGSAAVAAADPGFRDKAQETITTLINTVTQPHQGHPVPGRGNGRGNGAQEGAGHAPDNATPARGAPGRSGQENAPSHGPGDVPPGQETRPSTKQGGPPASMPAGGPANTPALPDRQKTENRPPPSSPSAKPRT